MKMTKKKFLLSVAIMMALASCTGSQKKSVVEGQDSVAVVTSVNNALSVDYCGTYEGILPCADCDGIKTTLKINNDATYDLKSEYLKKKSAVFTESGTYRVISDKIIELTTPSSGDKTYYKILDKAIALSDNEGTIAQGELAEDYILKKQ